MKAQQIAKISRSFELLGNPLRLRIFMTIVSQGCDCDIKQQDGITGNCISGIMKELDLRQSTVSTYIKDLTAAGLVECQKRGRILYTRPSKAGLIQLKAFLDGVISQLRFQV